MTPYKRGEVVLVSFPFTDLSGTKQRPAVVVSPHWLQRDSEDVILVAVTSQQPRSSSANLDIRVSNVAGTGLLKTSYIKPSKVVVIHQSLLRRRIGQLDSALLNDVSEAIRRIFS